jgi:hypothetical protein
MKVEIQKKFGFSSKAIFLVKVASAVVCRYNGREDGDPRGQAEGADDVKAG